MNLEGLKTLKELHQLLQIGAITADDFNVKKNEILQLQSNISAEDRIELLKELHQAMQDNIISQEDFDAIKPKLLNTVENNHIDFFDSEEKEENYYISSNDKIRRILAVVLLAALFLIPYMIISHQSKSSNWTENQKTYNSSFDNPQSSSDYSQSERVSIEAYRNGYRDGQYAYGLPASSTATAEESYMAHNYNYSSADIEVYKMGYYDGMYGNPQKY